MNMKNYENARRMITESEDSDFDGEKPEELVQKAEEALGLKFPPTYRRFLREFGCGDIGGKEFYGITDGNFESSSVPNAIWLTLNERKNGSLPDNYIIIYSDGFGNYCAIDANSKSEGNENLIVRLTVNNVKTEIIADNFGDFLNQEIKEIFD